MSEIAPEAQKALDKAMKVLEMAKRKKGNEAEAEAAAAAERARKEAEYAAWAAANPEEARAEEEEARKEREKRDARRRSSGRRSSADDNIDYSAYYRGYDAAEEIGLDQQVSNPSAGRLR